MLVKKGSRYDQEIRGLVHEMYEELERAEGEGDDGTETELFSEWERSFVRSTWDVVSSKSSFTIRQAAKVEEIYTKFRDR